MQEWRCNEYVSGFFFWTGRLLMVGAEQDNI